MNCICLCFVIFNFKIEMFKRLPINLDGVKTFKEFNPFFVKKI